MSTMTDRRQGLSSSLAFKAPCRLASTANLTLAGFQTVDGVLPTATEHEVLRRILVKNQDEASENGIYTMSSGSWARTKDFDSVSDFTRGTRVYVWAGTINAGYAFVVSTTIDPDTFVIDDDDLSFASQVDESNITLAAAGIISFGSGDVTITHATNALAFAGASSGYSFDGSITVSGTGNPFNAEYSDGDGATVGPDLSLTRTSTSPAANDLIGGVSFNGRDTGNNTIAYAQIRGVILNATDGGTEAGRIQMRARVANTNTEIMGIGPGVSIGSTTDMGAGTLNLSDSLYFGGIARVTRSSSELRFTGATGGYTFDTALKPSAAGGAAIGSSSVPWSAAHLTTGGGLYYGGVLADLELCTTVTSLSTGTAAVSNRGIAEVTGAAPTLYTMAAPPGAGVRKSFVVTSTSTAVRQILSAAPIVGGPSVGGNSGTLSGSTAYTVLTFNGRGQTLELIALSTALWQVANINGYTTAAVPLSS